MARKIVGAGTTAFTNQAATALYVDTAINNAKGRYVYVATVTGTTFTADNSYVGVLVTFTNSGAITVTLPDYATQPIGDGAVIDFTVLGTGMATFVAGGGAVIGATPSTVTRARYSAVSAIKLSANEWLLVGDLA